MDILLAFFSFFFPRENNGRGSLDENRIPKEKLEMEAIQRLTVTGQRDQVPRENFQRPACVYDVVPMFAFTRTYVRSSEKQCKCVEIEKISRNIGKQSDVGTTMIAISRGGDNARLDIKAEVVYTCV